MSATNERIPPTQTNIDSQTHLRGESLYLDDIPILTGTLFGACLGSPVAHGHIRSIDISAAEAVPGVIKVFTAKDIAGENEIGGIIQDEPLLADHEVHFCGMPVAFVVAETWDIARYAMKQIITDIEEHEPVTCPRKAKELGMLIHPPRTHRLGNVDEAFENCHYIFEGQADSNGQEHLYIETQGAYAVPQENGQIRIYSSTQGPTAVQKAVSKVLGVPQHSIEIDVTRLGGGFGGKEDQANTWAALCAMAAHHLQVPVKYALHRLDDMAMTGKRHPYSSDFKIGLSEDLKILAYEVTFYQNSGASADLSPAVLERTLFHCNNTYYIPNVRATAYPCKTHLPPNTAFRGFGGPQGMFVIESAIMFVAEKLGVDATDIQYRNLIQTGQPFAYRQLVDSDAQNCWHAAANAFNIGQIKKDIAVFNEQNEHYKKGMAIMPICFGISFTNTMMNNARALVHIYSDGSVNISTGAVEMGQGVNTKIMQVAAVTLGIHPRKIKILSTNTYRVANTSPSAASATADLNGKAAQIACTALLNRLKEVAAQQLNTTELDHICFKNGLVYLDDAETALTWEAVVMTAFVQRVALTENGHYATPKIHYDKATEQGHPFAYHVFGTSITEVTVDCIRGIYDIDSVKIVHDFGESMNTGIDMGQIEGGLVQGIGWMTLEEVVYDAKGKLRSNALSTYKVPDVYSVPGTITILPLETDKDNMAILKSKAVGEPPLMYGIGSYFAIRNAIKAFNPNAKIALDAPMTPEKTLMALYS
ncbi:xanthine dehydrogenase molybdopterin binding subunit [Polluticaenibacter yanchengensis]|uniref:Molybdopterin-dependent oxidoreductase n=1 Tax=Polluticaenibacter yanchengensis TaxID=3014562 RepID=A0ABT4UGM8_9BACT|nr:molybdopterin-dependent oxidoreductase [Chitinophagaceae bacterium LY-5]